MAGSNVRRHWSSARLCRTGVVNPAAISTRWTSEKVRMKACSLELALADPVPG